MLVSGSTIGQLRDSARELLKTDKGATREEETRRRGLRYYCKNRENEGESIKESGHWERTLVLVGGLQEMPLILGACRGAAHR